MLTTKNSCFENYATLTLTIFARGSGPLQYQWFQNGAPLSNAVAAIFSAASVSETSAGLFTVQVSNSLGSAVSQGVAVRVVPRPAFVNGSFESGNLNGWIVSDLPSDALPVGVRGEGYSPSALFFRSAPTDGAYCVVHGFDGVGPGTIRLAQDVSVPSKRPVLTFDYRAGWNLRTAHNPRYFEVTIEPAGGGTPPLAYQWFRNSQLLTGASNSSLIVTNIQTLDAGLYSLTVTNAFGQAASLAVQIQVVVEGAITAATTSIDGRFNVRFVVQGQASYAVLASSDLVSWTLLATLSSPAPGELNFAEEMPSQWRQRFYKIQRR